MDTDSKFIGKNVVRSGAMEKLRGEPVFSADIDVGSPLVLRALRSTRSHAEVVSIDAAEALAIEGVAAVFTAKDIPGENLYGIINKDQPYLASGKVRSTGDAVALVAADTENTLDRALAAIKVEYKDLPAVFDPEEAMGQNAPKIHEKGNILAVRRVRRGDADKAFERCTSIIEKTYRTSMVEHNYLEPDAGAGFIDGDGVLVVYASTQNPHYDHKELTSLLGIEDDRVRVIQAATGGGFGSKLDLNVQGFIALALYHLKRPVRYVYSREESYLATAKRHPLLIRMKTGADDRGRLLAIKASIICDSGAYGSYGLAVAGRAAVHATGPYEIENVEVESFCVYTNKPFCGAMRGFGTPQIAFAHESQIDLHARDLSIDPLEMRILNAHRPGTTTATGQTLQSSVGMVDCLEALRPYYAEAVKESEGPAARSHLRRGVGIGAMWYGIGNTGVQNPATAQVEMDLEGGVTLFTGCADLGQGSTTTLVQIIGEILGIDPHSIRTVVADTAHTANAGATSASRQTYISGNAVKEACERLVDVLMTEAADRLKSAKSALSLSSGHVFVPANPQRRISFGDLAKRLHAKGACLSWQGFFDPVTVPLDPENGQGIPYSTYAFGAQAAVIDVDALTGEVTVKRIVAAHDVGKAIHPENVVGQLCGGVAMGLGFALMEEFEPGKTKSMKDFHIPTCADMPEIVPIIIEVPEPTGPFGAKGVGEPALIPTAPAILNAISDALGQRIYTLPANLERVMEASIRSGHFGGYELRSHNHEVPEGQ